MTSHCRQCRQAAKLQPKFVTPNCAIEVMPNHTYKVERYGEMWVQNEARLKLYRASPDAEGQAPPLLEPVHRPTMRGRGIAYRELEEVLQDQKGAADIPTRPLRVLVTRTAQTVKETPQLPSNDLIPSTQYLEEEKEESSNYDGIRRPGRQVHTGQRSEVAEAYGSPMQGTEVGGCGIE